jgi:hypothetical protein
LLTQSSTYLIELLFFITWCFVVFIVATLEAISKMQITFKDKARVDEKAQSAKALWRMSSTF